MKQTQKRTKLPTQYKGGKKCGSCNAIIIHSYDYFNGIYLWKCQGCGATRYEPNARFETKFSTAAVIGK